MADSSIEIYIAQNAYRGFQRAYLFEYTPRFPSGESYKSKFLVRSTGVPSRSIEEIVLGWRGNDYKLAGKNTFEDFTVSFNVDADSEIIEKFHDWMNLINTPWMPSTARALEDQYFIDQYLYFIGNSASRAKGFLLRGAWPKSIGSVGLDNTTNDVAVFDVTFSFQYLQILPL